VSSILVELERLVRWRWRSLYCHTVDSTMGLGDSQFVWMSHDMT